MNDQRSQESILCDWHCDAQPSFNFEGESKGRFCSAHQLPGMINVINKRCEAAGCDKWPSFNFEGESTGRFCATHEDGKCGHEEAV